MAAIADKEARIAELEREAHDLEGRLQDAEQDNVNLVKDLQRQKDLYNDQLSKNTVLYEEINNLEKDLAAVNSEIDKLNSELGFLEDRYNKATTVNGELVTVIEELKEAIDQLADQNRVIIRELETIIDQDEHVRGILDRKDKIESLKNMAMDKISRYSHLKGTTVKKSTVTTTTTKSKRHTTTGFRQETDYEPAPRAKRTTTVFEKSVSRSGYKPRY